MTNSTPTSSSKPQRIRPYTARRREQCHRNQARYRNNQRLLIQGLETAVRDLKHQITGYEEQRRSLIQAMDTREASVKTVLEFSRLFRHGLDVGGGNAPVVTVCTSPVRSSLLEKQLAFIEATFAKDMRVRDFNGREWLIEQTERFSTFFGAHELRPSAIENVAIDPCGGSTIYARVELDRTITLTTIRQVFPHLSTLLTLKWTLLGHQMRCPASVVYELDVDSKVVRADWSIDFITGLLGALFIGEVGFVLHNARIQHGMYLLGNDHCGITHRCITEESEAIVG